MNMHEQLQILVAVLRLPRMCSEFHKALRKKEEQVQKQTQAMAVATLYRRMQNQDITSFMDNVLVGIEKEI